MGAEVARNSAPMWVTEAIFFLEMRKRGTNSKSQGRDFDQTYNNSYKALIAYD